MSKRLTMYNTALENTHKNNRIANLLFKWLHECDQAVLLNQPKHNYDISMYIEAILLDIKQYPNEKHLFIQDIETQKYKHPLSKIIRKSYPEWFMDLQKTVLT